MRSEAPLLSMTALKVEVDTPRGRSLIVDGLSLALHRGEILGLVGESGAGKSTVGLASMGFFKPGCRLAGGSIRFDGIELAGASETTLAALRGTRIAYVAQSAAASFNPAFRLMDQCVEVAVHHGIMSPQEAHNRTIELYKQMGLPNPDGIGARYPHQVSGGQLQRIMTAMAMVCRPDLIVFDEPTTALDVTTQVGVLASIRSIVEQHDTAAIYVSHDLAVVAQMADRVAVMKHGKLVEEADTRTMLTSPKAEYTKTLWAVREFQSPEQGKDAASLPLLKIDDISAHYGAVPVLKGIKFDVPASRTVAIVGESGSGKSTLAKVLTGLVRATGGSVQLNGKMLAPAAARRTREDLRSIQLIHQNPDTALNPRHTVRQIIERPLSLYLGMRGSRATKRVRELLSILELDPDALLNRLPHELSGGQKQRVCIARALAAEPKLIVCDEITSALDQVVAEGILKLLVKLQHEIGVSYLIITHDLTLVQAIADEVVILNAGEIVESGPKHSVLSPPHAPYTELLLSSAPEMDPDWLTNLLRQRACEAEGSAVSKPVLAFG